jgi:hypothetical protein
MASDERLAGPPLRSFHARPLKRPPSWAGPGVVVEPVFGLTGPPAGRSTGSGNHELTMSEAVPITDYRLDPPTSVNDGVGRRGRDRMTTAADW